MDLEQRKSPLPPRRQDSLPVDEPIEEKLIPQVSIETLTEPLPQTKEIAKKNTSFGIKKNLKWIIALVVLLVLGIVLFFVFSKKEKKLKNL